ncbi:hypothetical protein [Tianweitania sp.]|uniref:hypothetical protein n=1 Tax=Tianweitania sp. TaxID=2021634 RepID=UPI00289CB41F|nr:hypothetical protein [Tianweitania sp.]
MKRVLPILIAIVIAITATLGWRFYAYATNTESPYDEVGIELNSRAPRPLNDWACGRLKANFPNAVPPYGCNRDDGTVGWR